MYTSCDSLASQSSVGDSLIDSKCAATANHLICIDSNSGAQQFPFLSNHSHRNIASTFIHSYSKLVNVDDIHKYVQQFHVFSFSSTNQFGR